MRSPPTGGRDRHPPRILLDRACGTAMKAWLDRGGRLVYVGANGWYWRIAWHPTLPGVIEVRRAEDGIRTWEAQPGEYYHVVQRRIRRALAAPRPAAERHVRRRLHRPGLRSSAPTTCARRAASIRAPRSSSRASGRTRGSAISAWSAAAPPASSWTASSRASASPPNTPAAGELRGPHRPRGAGERGVHRGAAGPHRLAAPERARRPRLLRDAAGGAVFSTGSIAWCGSLSHNGYDNNVARITGNVHPPLPRPGAVHHVNDCASAGRR